MQNLYTENNFFNNVLKTTYMNEGVCQVSGLENLFVKMSTCPTRTQTKYHKKKNRKRKLMDSNIYMEIQKA